METAQGGGGRMLRRDSNGDENGFARALEVMVVRVNAGGDEKQDHNSDCDGR